MAALLSAAQWGCAPKPPAAGGTAVQSSGSMANGTSEGEVRPVELAEDQLATATVEVLSGSTDHQRHIDVLTAVVRRQLDRAQHYFDTEHTDMALATVRSTLYLVRAGQVRPEMFAGRGATLARAANELSRQGNEGQAEALYTLVTERLAESPERPEALAHLAALHQWQEDTRLRGTMQAQSAGLDARVHRALLDPSLEAQQQAHQQARTWVQRALTFGGEQRIPRNHFEQDETIAAFQAARTAALTLSALYLRQGDAKGALDAVSEAGVSRLTSPALRDRLEAAAENDPDAWMQLFELYSSRQSDDSPELDLDPELANAAAWGAATQLYRSGPKTLRSSVPLASLLLMDGLGEVVPTLLAPWVATVSEPRELGWVMGAVLSAIEQLGAVDDLEAALRTYHNAAPIIQLGASPAFAGQVSPEPGRIHFQMGAQLAASGQLAIAHDLLSKVGDSKPAVAALKLLASIDRQRGNSEQAIASLDKILKRPASQNSLASQAETHRLRFELLQDMGKSQEAAASLRNALELTLQARSAARTRPELAYIERLLGRLLEHYGLPEEARRAELRAFDASQNDLRQMTQSVLEASRRALTLGNIRSARLALRQAVQAELPGEDTVYAALWLHLLERRLGVQSDGAVQEALAGIDDATGWAATLTAWGLGRRTDTELQAAAENRTEQVEAMFYRAMSSLNRPESMELLQQVAASEAIQLVEVTIARDLLAQQRKLAIPNLPSDLQLP